MEAPPAPTTDRPDESPMREMMRIAGPVVLTMTSYTLMTFTDRWVCSHIGPDPIYVGALGNGGLASWVPISIAQGTVTVINTFVSQNMGAGQADRGPAYVWNGVWLCLAYWLLVLLPYGLAMPGVFRLAQMDPRQAELALSYGQVLIWGAGITMTTRAIGQFFYGMHRPRVVLVAGVVANIANLIFAAVLVFGEHAPATLGLFGRACAGLAGMLGVRPMGVAGSAWGTLAAGVVELAIIGGTFLLARDCVALGSRRAWRPRVQQAWDIVRVGWPQGLMFGNEMICWGFFMVYLVSHFGPSHATAGWIAHQYMQLSFMPAVGLSVACTAIVGKYQGMRRSDLAARRAWLAVALAAGYMGLCGVAFVLLRGPLIRAFINADTPPEQAAEVVSLGSGFLIATAAFQLFDGCAMTLSGALRGAGDTLWPGLATVVLSWGVIVGGGLALTHWAPGLQSLGPWIAAASYIACLCLFLLYRFIAGPWRSIELVHGRGG